MRLGIELWQTLCENAADSKLFAALRKYGYSYVEPCVMFGPPNPDYPALWTVDTVKEMNPIIRAEGLSIESCTIFKAAETWNIPEVVSFAEMYNIKVIVVKSPHEVTIESFSSAAEEYEKLAAALKEKGIRLMLHADINDCSARLEGTSAYEWLLDHCHGLEAQADIGWMYYGGIDVVAFIEKYYNRIGSIHYKDVKGTKQEYSDPAEAARCAIGKGVVPISNYIEYAKKREVYEMVDSEEQDGPILIEMKNAAEYLLNKR